MPYHSLHPAEKLRLNEPPFIPAYRTLLSDWIQEYPRAHRADLRRRVFDPAAARHEHYSARVEAYLHHELHARSARVVVHPKIAGGVTRPDFRAWIGGVRFLSEARVVFQEAELVKYDEAMDRLLDGLDGVQYPFRLFVQPSSGVLGGISVRAVRQCVEANLAQLDSQPFIGPVSFRFVDKSGFEIQFEVFGRLDHPSSSAVYWWPAAPGLGREITFHERIRSAVDVKAAHYGTPNEPLLLVLELLASPLVTRQTAERALFGDEKLVFTISQGVTVDVRDTHSLNGSFTRHNGGKAIGTRVSAVAFYIHTTPAGSTNNFELVFYHNPFASSPLSPSLFTGFPHMIPTLRTASSVEMGWLGGTLPGWE